MGLRGFITRRIVYTSFLIFAVIVLNFAIPRLMPGGPIGAFTDDPRLTLQFKAELIKRFGLDQPVWVQFEEYLTGVATLNFGISFSYSAPVMNIISQVLPWSIFLLASSQIIAWVISIFMGVEAAWRNGGTYDNAFSTTAMVLWSMPTVWLGMALLLAFAFYIPIFPLRGAITAGNTFSSTFAAIPDILWHAALPMLALVLTSLAAHAFTIRNTMLSVMKEDYLTTAEAKGLSSRRIKYTHAARNALLPSVTQIALSIAFVVGGSIFIEYIFNYPGLGSLTYNAVISRDYPLLQGAFFIYGIIVILANFIADISYGFLDPRVRY